MSEDYLCYNLLLCILLRGVLNSNIMFCEIFRFSKRCCFLNGFGVSLQNRLQYYIKANIHFTTSTIYDVYCTDA